MPKNYSEVVHALKEPFPAGAVVKNRFIPNQVYIDRLEAATGSEWDKEIIKLDIRPDAGYVCAIVRVRIGSHFRDGYKLETVALDAADKQLANAVDLAVNGAFVSAIDDWQIGWKNLAPTRDWASNPGITLLQSNHSTNHATTSITRLCSKCKKQLTQDDVANLANIPKLTIDYCIEHVPAFYMKKK